MQRQHPISIWKGKVSKMKQNPKDKARLAAMIIISLLVIATGALYAIGAFSKGDLWGAVAGIAIAVMILVFAGIVYVRGSRDLVKGFPLKDERSRKVMDMASSRAFYVSLYVLLAVGFLSEDLIPFRDVSQATSVTVGCMALLFAGFWAYYSRREI